MPTRKDSFRIRLRADNKDTNRVVGVAREKIFYCADWMAAPTNAKWITSFHGHAIHIKGSTTSSSPILGVTGTSVISLLPPTTSNKNFDLDLTLLFVADDSERDRRSGAAIAGRWKDEHIDTKVR